jgi:hypothetical protein
VIGTEGGAAIADNDGSVRAMVHAGGKVPAGRDGEISLFCISPRHFEAAALKLVQILVEGEYNGIFRPNIHYIPVKTDLSNLEQALIIAKDDKFANEIINRAYADLISSGKYNYQNFIKTIDQVLSHNQRIINYQNSAQTMGKSNAKTRAFWRLKMRAKLLRFFAQFYDKIALIIKFKNQIFNS